MTDKDERYTIFEYFSQQHDVLLLDDDINEVFNLVNKEREKEIKELKSNPRILTDNSKVNTNLLEENEQLKAKIKELESRKSGSKIDLVELQKKFDKLLEDMDGEDLSEWLKNHRAKQLLTKDKQQ